MIALALLILLSFSGLMQSHILTSIISYAEIIQFLSLFSLISINNYPSLLNQLYNAQSYWNFNFFPVPSFSFLDCENIHEDESIEGNYYNHPSILNINFLCNSFSILSSLFIISLTYTLSSLILCKICKKYKKSAEWNNFISLINGCIIVIPIFFFIQIFFVYIKLGNK